MKFLTVAFASSLLFASSASAQYQLQGHPQKGSYASPAEWLTTDQQCWINDPDPINAGHIHIVFKAPAYARMLNYDAFDVPFTLKAHNIAGIIGLVQGEHIRSIRWDATGSSELPVMRGNPNGLMEWSGVATVDLTLGDDGFLHIFQTPPHGWLEVRFFTRTALDDGKTLDASAVFPLYSAIDLSAPEKPAAEQGNPGVHHRASCVLYDAEGVAIAGEVITEVANYIPLLPIFAQFTTIVNAYNYTAPAGSILMNQLFEQRLDPDLHHGILGSLIRQDIITPEMNKQLVAPFVLDPAIMGTGNHKSMVVWTQPFPTQAVSAVIVFPVSVGEGVPPPTICTDPTATNFGGSLPCTYPTPPPTETLCTDTTATNFGQPLPCTFPVHVPVEALIPGPAVQQLTIDGVPQDRFFICTLTGCHEIAFR